MNPLWTREDEDLCELFRRNEYPDILWVLLKRYESGLKKVFFTYSRKGGDFDDFLHDMYLHLNDKLSTVVPRTFSAWLMQVAKNKLHDKGRKRHPQYTDQLPERTYTQTKEFDLTLDFALIQQLLRSLPGEEYHYVELVYFQGYKPREVQTLLQWSPRKSRLVYQKAMRYLRKYVGNQREQFL